MSKVVEHIKLMQDKALNDGDVDTAASLGILLDLVNEDDLRSKAVALRKAQKAYMADRGNEVLGKAVAKAASDLDAVLGNY